LVDAKDIFVADAWIKGGTNVGGRMLFDGKGMLYVVMQDAVGSVTAVDVKTMKATGHYSFIDKGGCNGLALDVKNRVLFAACGRSGNPPVQPAQPMMVILSATDGKIIASLPLAGGSLLLVTDGTANVAHLIDPASGAAVADVPTGTKPDAAASDRLCWLGL